MSYRYLINNFQMLKDDTPTATVTKLYNQTRKVLDAAQVENQATIITRNGKAIAAVVPVRELAGDEFLSRKANDA